MVLTNSHTISKSIVKNDEVINVIDSVHDLEDDKEHDIKQNRYHHRLAFRAEPMKNQQTESITDRITESLPNYDPNFNIQVSEHTDEVQVSKSRRKGFLRRLMDKIRRRKNKHLVTNGEIEQVKTTSWNIAAQKNLYVNNKTTAIVNDNSYTRPKRSHKNRKYRRKILSKRYNNPATNKIQSVIYDEDFFQNFKQISADFEKDKKKSSNDNDTWENNYRLTSISYQPVIKQDNELSLSEMTTKIDYLKEKYSTGPRPQNFTKYMPFLANSFNAYNLNKYKSSTTSTTLLKIDDFDKDFSDTDEIEDLLNVMKMRAIQIIANKTPLVTDIVSSFGTETVFETVPSFKDIFSLGRTFSTGNYIPINTYDVTKLPPTVKTIMARNIYKSPKQKTNVKREVVTNGKVLRKMYNNFKNQLSNEIKESQTALKNETKYWANKFTDKHTINCKTKKNSASQLFGYEDYDDLGSNQNRDRKSNLKQGKSKQIAGNSTYTIPLKDNDYPMLSLYEKLLSKPHQNNLITMPTTESIKKRNAVENHVIYNRNQNIFSYFEDKEKDIGIPYKVVDPMDEYDEYENIQNEKPTKKFGPTPQKNKKPYGKTTTFKDLADKLSYNDYVNGYKHYLKFQKEQGAQNYSNLVRYQAHRHHSVDDIGKFILNKLPQVPERHKRAFYDESETTEDLDISTKNEESWFKKHFYLFIDSGQPKKFHSSETVSLRPSVAETDKVRHLSTENSIKKPSTMKARQIQKKIEETDLDRLSNVLEKYKNHPTPSTTTHQRYISNGYHTTSAVVTNYGTADVSVKFKDMIEKLFGGKKLRNAKPLSELEYRNTEKRNMVTEADIDLLLDNSLKRSKRNSYARDTNNEYQLYHSYLPQEEIKSKLSSDLSSPTTYKNYGYVDVNVITRPTAVVKLREAKKESKFKKFFKHLGFHFHKKKDKEIKKSKIHKRESMNRVQRSNPLKKLKKMFNVRIDGKPDTRSKGFDYDIIDTHVSSFKPFRHDKTSYLEDNDVEIPNVTEDVLYKTKTVGNDISYNAPVLKNSYLAKKNFQHNPMKYNFMNASDKYNYIDDPSEILISTKYSPQKPQVIPKKSSSSKDDVAIDEENYQETEAVIGNIKRQVKLSEKPHNITSQNTEKRKLTSLRHRYHTIPDYFKDFERWHNDLLHSEKFTTWQSILDDINYSNKYNAPNVTFLKKELSRMHEFLNINHDENIEDDNNRDMLKGIKKQMLTTKAVTNIMKRKTAKAALRNSSLKNKNLVKREGGTNSNFSIYHNSNEGKFDTHQNYSITNSQPKNLSRIMNEEYHKLIHPFSHNVQIEDSSKTDKASKGTTTPKNTDNTPETTYFIDTSLLAYDDGPNFITEEVTEAIDEPTLQSSLGMHVVDAVNSVTRFHKVPEQYFATPIPMENKDFDKFLKENYLDVISVTSPLHHSSRKTTKNDRQPQYDSTSLINFKNLPEQYNKLKQSLKMSKYLEFKNMSENTKDWNFDSISIQNLSKKYNVGSKLEPKNTFVNKYKSNINRDYDEKRRKRASFKPSQPEKPIAGFLDYGTYSKYSKLKDHFKNVERKDEETKETEHSTSNILDELEGTVIDYDNSEDPQFENTKANEQSNIKGESTTKGEQFKKSLQKNEKKPLHKNVTINQFDHKTNSTKKGSAESKKQLKTNVTHKIPGKAKPHGNHPMHNNLLFNYVYGDGKTQIIKKPYGNVPYILTNDSHHNYKGPIKMSRDSKLADPNIRVEKSSNPKRIQITSNSYKYDIIYEDDFSDKHNVNNKDITTPRLQVFGQHGFYSMKVNGSANDSDGAAEPRLAMDLTFVNGARRVQRSQKDNNSTSRSLRNTTLEPLRRGTLIYDLKQMDRGNNKETKQRRGPFKSLHGTSVLSLLQKQIQTRLTETKRPPTSKSSVKPPTKNQTENSSTTTKNNRTVNKISGNNNGKNPHENLKQNKDVNNTNESVRKSFSPQEKHKTNAGERTLPVKDDLKVKVTLTPKIKCSKSLKAKDHTTNTVSNGDEKETSKSEVTTHRKANVKDFKTKKHRNLAIITKIYSEKKQQLSDYEFVFPNTKILPTKAEVTSIIAKVTSEPNDEKTEITKEKYTTAKTTSTQNAISTTKENTAVSFVPEIGTMFSQNELDLKAPADEDSFYVTSNNYYDYHTGDLEYNLNESKVVKIENTTKIKNDSAVKHDKRDIKSQNTFTAKDVAAIEVIVDLMRNSRNSEENELADTINENTGTTLSDSGQASSRANDIASNSIQVHIAIPYNLSNEKRRSLDDPVKIRKVFSAKLSTPVDMEYQIHSAEELEPSSSEPDTSTSYNTAILSATSSKMDALSPGMYLLEENMNNLMPKGKYILRPIYDKRFLSDCKIRQAVTKSIITHKATTVDPPNNLAKVTLSKDFIAALDQHLQQLYLNLTSAPDHKIKARNIYLRKILKPKHRTYSVHRPRRHINWDTIKKYFGHDRVCNCHCKPNRTMCRACAASDAVISELIFELDNLAQYMNDHCTEIQTYFWMNPSGGRKLREAVQRIDKTLYNYYKRVKGKCKGRPCKTFTYMDKRDFVNFDKRVDYIGEPLIRDIEKIADDLEQAAEFNIGDDTLAKTGIKCLDVITKCMHLKPFNKRADESIGNRNRLRNVYSLDNVNVNIICKSDSQMDKTQNNIYLSTLTSTYLTESPSIFYYDMDEFKNEEKQKKGIKSFLSRKSNMKKKRKNKNHLFTYYVTPSESRLSSNNMILKKRQVNNNQIESPLITETGGLFWFDYINGNKNKNQYVEEQNNRDNSYNFQSNYDLKENNDKITKTENCTDYQYSSYENSSVNDLNPNDLTESTNFFTNFMINNNVSQFTTQNMQTTKTKQKMSRLTTTSNEIIDVNRSKSIRHRIKELLELLDPDDFGSFEETTFPDVSIQNNDKTSFEDRLLSRSEIQKHRKRKIFNKSFQKFTQKVTPSTTTTTTTTTVSTSMLFQPTAINTETTRNKENVTRRNYLNRLKEATLKFLDKLDGTKNFIIDEKTTTPIYVYGKKSKSNNRLISNLFLNRKRDLKSSKVNKDDVAVDRDIHGDAINIRDNNMTNNEQLKDDLDLNSNLLESVKESNKNKELLLSILDFETNKLNDEWTRIEKRKTEVEDSKNDMDDVGQIIFQLHSDVNSIVPEKTTDTKVDCTATAESCYNQTIASQCQNITNITKKNTTDDSQGKCYDIVKDLRALELTVPPELTSTRAYNGFLDKFIHKFAFKNVPNLYKKKAVNSHLNAPKERSLRGKMEHGKRYRSKVHCKMKPNKNATDIEDLEQPPSSLNTFTVTNEGIEIKTTVTITSKLPKTTTSTTKKSARKNIEYEIGNDAITPDKSKENIGTTNDKYENEEVYEPNADPTKYICDINATVMHIQEMFQNLSKTDFGKYVKNISCFKYKKAPSAFHIKATSKQSKKKFKIHSKTGHGYATDLTKKKLKWNWIRDKRSSQLNSDAFGDFTNWKDLNNDYFDDVDDESRGFEVENLRGSLQYALRDEKEDYDRLYLDGDGVYRRRENERKKRGAVDMSDVVNGLRNLPPLRPLIDEIFVIRGDSVTIQCNASGGPAYSYLNLSNMYEYTWSTERKAMLQCSNTKVYGSTISIVNVQPRNFGTYTCFEDKSVIRSVKLNVIVVPDFNIVFTTLYKCQSECTYEDLKNIQKLGPVMFKAMYWGEESCPIRIDEPVCMSNKDNEALLRSTVVVKPSSQPTIECSPECQRDLKCSMALLWASNAPSLALVKVIIAYDELNKTLTPLDTCDSDLTTVMALKKKDSNGHNEYRRLVLGMERGNVDVVVTCPAGFYLLADQKICVVCPVDTCSLAGENTCTACPRGTHAPPGASTCRLAFGPHRGYIAR
ncbi:unnamed protein product [Parnassius apollo]|uniref:(apollo) hypothetical protein n=1 Tax=Parnassius apollo TaxID=110799 RepID=A0A8S3X950_PARAO|nr:unnamed protein product [Parnassius apollo]